MVSPETALGSVSRPDGLAAEQPAGASGTRLKVAARPATVGATWMDLFQPGTAAPADLEARLRVVADVAGALVQIHDNPGLPRPHRRHGRLTPRHVLVGVDGSASLFTAREPFSKLLPPQPDLGYLAPELLTQSGPATQHSDVFSLGVLLWEALDNGRLFPHRRAAAISRLIARRSLPGPRIEDEWALPLGEVAMKALSQDPADRYPDATAFWLALREHMPAPDAARAQLSRLAQRALKLELTTDIREAPPYLVRSGPLGTGSSARPGPSDALTDDAPARYSLHPERSSRLSLTSRAPLDASEDAAWALSEPPPARLGSERLTPDPISLRPSPPPPAAGERSPSDTPAPRPSSSSPAPARALSEPPPGGDASRISTLHVNLPRELMDASLPFYVPSQPAPRPFPWGAIGVAALMFFGVGAAVAFGAVSALRGPVMHEAAPLPAPPAAAAAATATPPEPARAASPSAEAPEPPSLPSAPAPQPASDARGAEPSKSTPAAVPVRAKPETTRKAARRSRPARAKRPKLELALPRETPPEAAPQNPELEREPWTEPAAAAAGTQASDGATPVTDTPEKAPESPAPPVTGSKPETPPKPEPAPSPDGAEPGAQALPFVEQPY